ncbi:MAG: hypothetical protein II297_01410 [Clostridia bacterium]|nr:hypothetical protein [Clostridia bacterium]
MKKTCKNLIAILLVLSMLLGMSVTAFAASGVEEEYISELRLIYVDSYEEAQEILSETALEGYKIFNHSLNGNSGLVNTMLGTTGVWLAYKTTTDIDEAITDVAIMQMGGGYTVGNYQQMIDQSRKEYEAMGAIYVDAIDYLAEAYEAGDFLADAAYRQLNFYNGVDNYADDKLGDLFIDGVLSKNSLATLFFEGNATVINNIRRLIALGVSYNGDGKTYLEKVGESATEMEADPSVFDQAGYKDLAKMIATSIPVFQNKFNELSAYEAELNYEDDEFTDLELKYAEYKSIAERMRKVNYLGGKTLYEFCMEYSATTDASKLYPLVDALNDGQVAMTKVFHYYDVVRYSMSDSPEELIDSEISALEEKYSESPVSVYLGVDRDLYKGSFAITSEAARADAYTDSTSLGEALFGNGAWVSTSLQMATGALGVGLAVWAIVRTVKGTAASAGDDAVLAAEAASTLEDKAREAAEDHMLSPRFNYSGGLDDLRDFLVGKNRVDVKVVTEFSDDVWATLKFADKIEALEGQVNKLPTSKIEDLRNIGNGYYEEFRRAYEEAEDEVYDAAVRNSKIFTGALYAVGAMASAYSAFSQFKKIYDYYHPTYDEIPIAMVDLVKTVDGDRYIKYDVVYEAQLKDGKTHAGDLNAYKGQRWNAMYYTKSSEAGNPLLVDFEVSNNNNRPGKGYSAVHRFGETICYDLNKYNFNGDSETVFMSIAQSAKQKSDVTSVPDVVGSIFGAGVWLIAGSIGVTLGVGCTLGTQLLLKKKKKGSRGEPSVAKQKN